MTFPFSFIQKLLFFLWDKMLPIFMTLLLAWDFEPCRLYLSTEKSHLFKWQLCHRQRRSLFARKTIREKWNYLQWMINMMSCCGSKEQMFKRHLKQFQTNGVSFWIPVLSSHFFDTVAVTFEGGIEISSILTCFQRIKKSCCHMQQATLHNKQKHLCKICIFW